MKKLFAVAGLFLFIFASCSSKNYNLDSKPVVTFKTSLGDIQVQFYKNAAPKTVEAFLDLIKQKKYAGTSVDEVMFANSVISIGFNEKVLVYNIKENLAEEAAVAEKKKLEKNELLFRADNEAFGAFSIYCGDSAIEMTEPLVIFGKVTGGAEVLSKMLDMRVDKDFRPSEKIMITDTVIAE